MCPRTASRPSGLRSRRYAKLPLLERSPVVGAPRSLRALRAAACRPSGVLALWHMSGALRIVLVSGLRPSILCLPPPTRGPCLLRGIGARSARPPPKGAPSARARLHFGFATSLEACNAINTGATCLTACKPAWPLAYFSSVNLVAHTIYLIAACARSTRARSLFCI